MDEIKPLRYLLDNLRIFLRDKIDSTYGGAPMRLSGDERRLLRDILEYFEAQQEQRQRGGEAARGKSGRPREKGASKAALYQRERRARLKR